MGCSDCRTNELKDDIKMDIIKNEKELEKKNEELNNINNSIEDEKKNIITIIDNETNFKIMNEVQKYYDLLEKREKILLELNTLSKRKYDLNDLNKEILDTNIFNNYKETTRINSKYWKIKRELPNKYSDEKNNQIYVEKIKNFCELYEKNTKKIDGIDNRKNNFKNNFIEEKNENSFIYSGLQNTFDQYLKKFDNSVNDFGKNLKTNNNEIKVIIKKILNGKIDQKQIDQMFNNLKNKMQELIINQNDLENNLLEEKRNEMQKALIEHRKNIISSKFNDLKRLINIINELKPYLDKIISNWSYLIKLINEKENKNYYISFLLKDKFEKMQKLKNNRNKINSFINSITSQIEKINKFVNEVNICEKNIPNIKYINNQQYNSEINVLDNLKKSFEEIKSNIDIILEKNKNMFPDMKKNIENLMKEPDIVIKDSFDEENNNKDKKYIMFKKKEEEILMKWFHENKDDIVKKIFQKNKNFGLINANIIDQIFINEKVENICKMKMIKKIDAISNDDEKFNINHLTILLVGRKEIGKTTLIKYMLELNDDFNNNDNNTKNVFKIYKSNKITYLRLIEAKGIGYDKDSTPEYIKNKIVNYIKDEKNQNFNSVIHCIWYCFSGTRFEKEEKSLFYSLKELYKDNVIPIILVFTKSTEKSLFIETKQNFEIDSINNSLIEVMAEDMLLPNKKIISAFGKEELLKTTLLKCKEAFQSDMMKIMIQ